MEELIITILVIALTLMIVLYFKPKKKKLRPLTDEEMEYCWKILENCVDVGMLEELSDSKRKTFQSTAKKMINYIQNGYYKGENLIYVLDNIPDYFRGTITTDLEKHKADLEHAKPTPTSFFNRYDNYCVWDEEKGWICFESYNSYTHDETGIIVGDMHKEKYSQDTYNYEYDLKDCN